MACFMQPHSPATPASGVDMIYVNHKMWRGDLTSVQLSSRTSPGRRASIYKQCYIHVSVTCSIYTAWAELLPHKWNIIPRHVRFVFLSALCFLSCIALAVGELVSSSPQHGAMEKGRGRLTFAAISSSAWWQMSTGPQAGRLVKLAWGLQDAPQFPQAGGEQAGPPLCYNQSGCRATAFHRSQSPCLCSWCPSPSHRLLAVPMLVGHWAPGRSQSWPCFHESSQELLEP